MADNLSIQGHAHAADTETPASVVKPPALALGPLGWIRAQPVQQLVQLDPDDPDPVAGV